MTCLSTQTVRAFLALTFMVPGLASAATLDGAALGPWWGLPFAGILLSIALLPLLAPAILHHHYGKISAGWALAFLLPFAAEFGQALAEE